MNVVILHDAAATNGPTDEQDAMVQVGFVGETLRELGYPVTVHATDSNIATLSSTLIRFRPDVVFNLVESINGDGRLIHIVPSTLETLGITFTGSPAAAVFSTTSKVLSKEIMRGRGLPTPEWHIARPGGAQIDFFPGQFILKPVWEDASKGIDDASVRQFDTVAELADALDERSRAVALECFAERFIEGREFNVSLIEEDDAPRVLPVAEMTFVNYPADKPRLVGYAAKWDAGSFEYSNTVRRFGTANPELEMQLARLSRAAWDCFGLRGYARVDLRVDESGQPWILEVNVNPCISPDAGFAAAATEGGLTHRAMITRIINAAAAGRDRNGATRRKES